MKRVVLSAEREALFRKEWADKTITLDNIETSMGHTGETLRRLAGELGLAPREEPGPWTPEFTALIVRRYGTGESPTDLGREFGLTRNQVTAKLSRLGKIRRRTSKPRLVQPVTIPRLAAAPTPAQIVVPFHAEPAKPSGFQIDSRHLCQWPIGDPREPDFTFCGQPAPESRSYCADHHARGHQPSQPRKVSTDPFAERVRARFGS